MCEKEWWYLQIWSSLPSSVSKCLIFTEASPCFQKIDATLPKYHTLRIPETEKQTWQNGKKARGQEGKMAKWQKGREAKVHEGKIEIESIFRWKMCEVRWRGNKWFAYHEVPQNSEQLRIQKLSLSSLSAVFYQFLQFRLFISVSFAMTATQWLIIQS